MLPGDQDLCARDYERDTAWYPTVKDILPEYYPDKRKVSISVYPINMPGESIGIVIGSQSSL